VASSVDNRSTSRRAAISGWRPEALRTWVKRAKIVAGLRALREHRQARALDEDTLSRCKRVLGDDHPSTLASASNLAFDLKAPQAL
jgi:hypothetical protein